MSRTNLWDRWLWFVGWLLIVFGFMLGFLNQSDLFDLAFNRQINPVFWPSGMPSHNSGLFQAWAYGVLGFTVSGWGVFIAFIARYPFRERHRWARNCLFAGITLWYVPDTGLSLYFGVTFNAMFNTVLLCLVYIPLFATWAEFRDG